mmetsp:Transcript_8711/g.31399  ORF Transcript_8711/g.31399 Transcript_8711/m.31399 type:complete len:227 (-) Transcript_8711:816-1496(-)
MPKYSASLLARAVRRFPLPSSSSDDETSSSSLSLSNSDSTALLSGIFLGPSAFFASSKVENSGRGRRPRLSGVLALALVVVEKSSALPSHDLSSVYTSRGESDTPKPLDFCSLLVSIRELSWRKEEASSSVRECMNTAGHCMEAAESPSDAIVAAKENRGSPLGRSSPDPSLAKITGTALWAAAWVLLWSPRRGDASRAAASSSPPTAPAACTLLCRSLDVETRGL